MAMAMAVVITKVATRAVAVVHAVKVRISVPRYSLFLILYFCSISLFLSLSLYPFSYIQFDAFATAENCSVHTYSYSNLSAAARSGDSSLTPRFEMWIVGESVASTWISVHFNLQEHQNTHSIKERFHLIVHASLRCLLLVRVAYSLYRSNKTELTIANTPAHVCQRERISFQIVRSLLP